MIIMTIIILGLLIALGIVGQINNQADWGHWRSNICDGLVRSYCRRFHRQGTGQIEIPAGKKVLLASNHISGIDPFLLVTALRQPVRFMIAKEQYERPVMNRMFRAAGCIPVNRGGRVESAFRSALRAIDAGELVGIFPQGGIHHEDIPREKIKPGIIKLSELSQCDILPVRITGVGAPGTVVKSVVTRSSQINFEVHDLISPAQAKDPKFREAMAEWLLGKRESIFEKS